MSKKILVLPGDGIGPEITAQAVKVLEALKRECELDVAMEEGRVGGAAIDAEGTPLADETLARAQAADAVLLGAVGGPRWDDLPMEERPEKGLLRLRAGLGLFANLRPALLYPQLASASTLRPEVVAGLDLMIVRELTGGIYFGEPRGVRTLDDGQRQGYNTLVYSEAEIRRIGRVAFETARRRGKRLCSVDKANVLEWFDVIVTTNMFGDILSDEAAMLTGSIGMLPSAALNERGQGMYEPIHGSAPDIAGQDLANPLATILSVAMMLRHSLGEPGLAEKVEQAVSDVLDEGLRTADIHTEGTRRVGTEEMGDAVVAALIRRLWGAGDGVNDPEHCRHAGLSNEID